ncbi:hypothetical protein HELRODRAFT_189581 [Helobdella robusta]|uniref:BACK domain-containing protein n=1 Tax=Helobdella robusta TaxID=6412 RepID=T1FR62_HELRO|nr:hypothetical protein HELRODRAFT_189581 [Helobdella robusta]ESN92711.1 hypothetical protein HELRODRAFT_189581 [Helobdella robusta]
MKKKGVELNKNCKMEKDNAVDEPAKMVLISNEGGRYEVAKDLLLQSSDYFQALANSGMRDANFKELTLECLSDACLHEVEHFLSNVQSNEDHFGARDLCCVEKGLEGSLYLQIRSMTDKYLNNLLGLLNESTYARILQFANKFDLFEAIERVFEFIFDNLKCIILRSEILSLSPDGMIRLVESELVNVDCELDIFDLIVRWTSADESRRQYAELLFSKVKYNLMAEPEKRKASNVLEKLKINVQTEDHGFRTVGKIFGFGAPEIEVEQPFSSLSVYDFVKTLSNKTTVFPFDDFKYIKIRKWIPLFVGHRICTANNQIYFAGGVYKCDSTTKSLKVYDVISSKWSQLSSMHVARAFFYFGEMGGHLYAVAGVTLFGDHRTFIQTAERYIPGEDRWYTIAPLPIAVAFLSGTACNGLLYVSGGYKEDGISVNLVYMYNPACNQWFEKAPMLTARNDHFMTALRDKIFVVGGKRVPTVEVEDNLESVMDAEMFDCTTEQWTSVLTLKQSFWTPQNAIILNGSLFCFTLNWFKHNYSIQEINLKKYLDVDTSSSNATSDEDACILYNYSTQSDLIWAWDLQAFYITIPTIPLNQI